MYHVMQVLPIWEGTTNILSLDFLRVLQKVGVHEVRWRHSFVSLFAIVLPYTPSPSLPPSPCCQVFEILVHTIKFRLSLLPLTKCELTTEAELLQQQLQSVMTFVLQAATEDLKSLEVAARDIALSLAHIYIGNIISVSLLYLRNLPVCCCVCRYVGGGTCMFTRWWPQ